ncbi:hypothetical protein AOH207_07510 [Helicobacter pylori]
MVSLIIVSPLPNLDLVSKTAKNHHTLEWSIDVFERSHYITILGIFSLIIVNIEKFQSLQASKG